MQFKPLKSSLPPLPIPDQEDSQETKYRRRMGKAKRAHPPLQDGDGHGLPPFAHPTAHLRVVNSFSGIAQVLDDMTEIWAGWRRKKLPTYLFLALCLNLVVAPVVYASSGSEFSRSQAWALGLLGVGTVALSIYLFFVMFIPEKF